MCGGLLTRAGQWHNHPESWRSAPTSTTQHESAFLFSLMGIGLLPGGVRFQLW
nr:MAG TPA: MPN family protein [Caudoviricetes sp.]